MISRRYIRTVYAVIAAGGVLAFVSCGGGKSGSLDNLEGMISHQSDTLTMITSTNGGLEMRFYTPLMERYEYAREPYMEFRRGVDVTTYDSLNAMKSNLIADYAIFLEKQQLWEAKGNVVAINASGEKLETQQLFWNQKTGRVYSNVDSKVTQPGGNVVVGEGFESDEAFEQWTFRRAKGTIYVDSEDVEAKQQADTAGRDRPRPAAPAAPPPPGNTPAPGLRIGNQPVQEPVRKEDPAKLSSNNEEEQEGR